MGSLVFSQRVGRSVAGAGTAGGAGGAGGSAGGAARAAEGAPRHADGQQRMFQRLAAPRWTRTGQDARHAARFGATRAEEQTAQALALHECTAAHWLAQFGEGQALTQTLDDPCSICLEDMHRSELVLALQCGHLYHASCVRAWLGRRQWCPLCKAPAL